MTRRTARVPVVLTVLGAVVLGVSMFVMAAAGHPLSTVDEHIHLDTQFKVHHGHYPYRGDLMGHDVIQEWACGVGHVSGHLLAPCGDPGLSAESVPSGKYTSGYIHYPTYFLGGEAFRWVTDTVLGAGEPIDRYREYAAFWMALALAVCGGASWRLGLRGADLVAGTLVPVAASGIAFYGTIVNPSASALATGALIGAAGLRWVLHGRGYAWLLAATAFAAAISVTDSLPAGTFILAVLGALLARRRGWRIPGAWRPKLWHAALLGLVVLLPVVAYGRIIEARATVDNATLYAFAPTGGFWAAVSGGIQELVVIHSPWFEGGVLTIVGDHPVARSLRAFGAGVPGLLTLLVFGVLLLHAGGRVLRTRQGAAHPAELDATDGGRELPLVWLLVVCTLVVLVLYPPALRVSNMMTFGIDFGIVSRYSIPFAPLLTWLLLKVAPHPWLSRVAAVLALVSAATLSLSALPA
jgi:hypothetical protein